MKNKKLILQERITADVDDEIYALKKKVQKKFNLSWEKARDGVNEAIKDLFSV